MNWELTQKSKDAVPTNRTVDSNPLTGAKPGSRRMPRCGIKLIQY